MSPSSANRPLDHVAIAVHSIEASSSLFELVSGDRCSSPETLEAHGVRVAFVGRLELLEPLGPDTSVGRFLAKRGQAVHHIAYRVEDLDAELDSLEAAGLRLIDRVPLPGAHGKRVAFLHPSSTGGILIELVEAAP